MASFHISVLWIIPSTEPIITAALTVVEVVVFQINRGGVDPTAVGQHNTAISMKWIGG